MVWAFGPPKRAKIPLPPLATRRTIVAEINAEQALAAANRELIARFEQKIQANLARVWGEPEETALAAANRELIARFEQKIQATLARVWGDDSESANGALPSQPGAKPQVSKPKH